MCFACFSCGWGSRPCGGLAGAQGFSSLRTSPLPNPPAPFKGEVCRRSATLGGLYVFLGNVAVLEKMIIFADDYSNT